MSHLSVGALVDVLPEIRRGRPNSEGGRGYIVRRSSSPTSVTSSYDVEYILTRKISKEVNPERLSPAMIETVARRRPRSAFDDIPIQPSLLSTYHHASQQLMSKVTPSLPKRAKSNLITSDILLEQSHTWSSSSSKGATSHPILVYLQRNNNREKGYLHWNDAKAAGVIDKLKSNCSPEEKNRILRIKDQLTGVIDFNQHGVTQLIAHAYGIGKRTLQDWQKKGMDQSGKQRKDAGATILTSAKLQDNWFSAYNCWKKSQRRQKISNTLLDADEDDSNFKEEWNAMPPEQRKPYTEMSDSLKTRAPFLIGEIQSALHSTGGYCTWRQLESHLASLDGIPIISYQQIRRLVMGLPDSTYVSTRLFPCIIQLTTVDWFMIQSVCGSPLRPVTCLCLLYFVC